MAKHELGLFGEMHDLGPSTDLEVTPATPEVAMTTFFAGLERFAA